VSNVRTDPPVGRYGAPSPARRRAVVVAAGLVGLVALTWLVWVIWFHGNPQVQSSMRSFEVVDDHAVSAVVLVRADSDDVDANCLLRAFGEDHSVVGERNFEVAGSTGTTVREVTVRTERAATSVELVGCTAAGQSRPR
jgi:hypothetical protein